MIIFFSCSTKDIVKYKNFYREIRNSIKDLGHSINRDWIDKSVEFAEKKIKDVPPSSVYKDVMSAIVTADLVVVDATVASMSVGHQLTFALQKMKPVLLLQFIKGNKEDKELFIGGAKSPLLMIKNYGSIKEIKPIIKDFIRKYESTSKTRFNLVLNKAQDSYVQWAAFSYKKSKTEIIQESINEKMEKDKNFEKNLDL